MFCLHSDKIAVNLQIVSVPSLSSPILYCVMYTSPADPVSGEDGSLTPVGSLAHNLSQLHTREKRAAAKKVVHVTCHGDSFRLQQALVLAQISAGSNSRLNPSPPQVLSLPTVEPPNNESIETAEIFFIVQQYKCRNILIMRGFYSWGSLLSDTPELVVVAQVVEHSAQTDIQLTFD